MSVAKESLVCRIDGMDCPDCAAKIKKVVSSVPGVSQAHADFVGETLSAQAAERVRIL